MSTLWCDRASGRLLLVSLLITWTTALLLQWHRANWFAPSCSPYCCSKDDIGCSSLHVFWMILAKSIGTRLRYKMHCIPRYWKHLGWLPRPLWGGAIPAPKTGRSSAVWTDATTRFVNEPEDWAFCWAVASSFKVSIGQWMKLCPGRTTMLASCRRPTNSRSSLTQYLQWDHLV